MAIIGEPIFGLYRKVALNQGVSGKVKNTNTWIERCTSK